MPTLYGIIYAIQEVNAMLSKCPECGLQISDKAYVCPHCGCPLKGDSPRPYVRKKQRMRLPNGFGQISEIKGRNLRHPFRAMVTVGVTEHGRPICKILSGFCMKWKK